MNAEEILRKILQRLEVIEEHLSLKPRSLFDNLNPTVTITDASKLMGCTEAKIRQYIKWKMLETFKVGRRRMVVSHSLKKLIDSNSEAQNKSS